MQQNGICQEFYANQMSFSYVMCNIVAYKRRQQECRKVNQDEIRRKGPQVKKGKWDDTGRTGKDAGGTSPHHHRVRAGWTVPKKSGDLPEAGGCFSCASQLPVF